MKRFLSIAASFAIAVLCFTSCGEKDTSGSGDTPTEENKFPVGTKWSGDEGTITFSTTTISFTDKSGATVSAQYNVTSRQEGYGVKYTTSIKIKGKTFTWGTAMENISTAVLYDSGPTTALNFTLVK